MRNKRRNTLYNTPKSPKNCCANTGLIPLNNATHFDVTTTYMYKYNTNTVSYVHIQKKDAKSFQHPSNQSKKLI